LKTNFRSPNTAETAREIKERMWRYEQKAIIDMKSDTMSWELRELLHAWCCKNYGPLHVPRAK
jgi:hypothetical protein